MKTHSMIILAALALVLALSATAAGADGAALFKSKCAMCHGADGGGQTPVGRSMKIPDLRSPEVQKQTDIQLTDVIAGGKRKMPAYGKTLSTAEIQALIAQIRTLKK